MTRATWTRTCVACGLVFGARSPLTKWCVNCQDAKIAYQQQQRHEYAVRRWQDPTYRVLSKARHQTPEFKAKDAQRHRDYLKDPVVRRRTSLYQQAYRDAHKADHAAYVKTPEYKAKRREYIRSHPEHWGNFWASGPDADTLQWWSEFVGLDLD